ncbi:hypothetical protein HPG69_017227 [Diceros bicornis minor]|uniref:dihydrofolate reductase n=1 Tax=Diceros bicornis minor TaxID=77932 RepID=A0A7J7ED45_DICBM|nr:hypothetical protein HPG69_017227 [Diceros bicornis minor]
MMRPLNCIVAVSQNMGIGKNGDLPWPRLRYLLGGGGLGVRGSKLAQDALDPGTWPGPRRADGQREDGSGLRHELTEPGTGFFFCVRSRETKLLISVPLLLPCEALPRGTPLQSKVPVLETPPPPQRTDNFKHRELDELILWREEDNQGNEYGGKQNLVIMGRKTWFSIPEKNRPLKDRINLVLSRELKEPPQGAHFLAKSLEDALSLIEQPELTNKVDMVWIVGGSSVYKEAMNKPGHLRLFVTRIMQEFESDTFFPEIDFEKYKLLPEYPGVLSDIQEEKGIKYKFEVYEKND